MTRRPVAPAGLEVGRFHFQGDELVVLSYPLPDRDQLARLTATEQEIAQALLEGKSTAEIAAQRRRSRSTVANQVASIFRKLGARSRAELVARLCDRPAAR